MTSDEVRQLEDIISKGRHTAQRYKRARALLLAHQRWTDARIAETTTLTPRSVQRIRRRFVEDGFELALRNKPRRPRGKKLDGRGEAHLIALACSEAPGRKARYDTQYERLGTANLFMGTSKNTFSTTKGTKFHEK